MQVGNGADEMIDGTRDSPFGVSRKATQAGRLKSALRENLKKRKNQTRKLAKSGGVDAVSPDAVKLRKRALGPSPETEVDGNTE